MHDGTSEVDAVISQLNDCEKRVMLFLGKEDISQNKNIRKETIKNRLPNKYSKDVDKTLRSLINKKKLVRRYRNKNYALNSLGLKVSQALKQEFRHNKYADLSRILMIMP